MVAKKKRTAKQIAATKRLVAFNKKRRAKKTVKKVVRRKSPAKKRKAPVKKRATRTRSKVAAKNYVVKVVWNGKAAYSNGGDKIDTLKVNATKYTKAGAERKAHEIFNKFSQSSSLKSVSVVKK